MYGIYANIWGILMVNVTIYGIHGSYGYGYKGTCGKKMCSFGRILVSMPSHGLDKVSVCTHRVKQLNSDCSFA